MPSIYIHIHKMSVSHPKKEVYCLYSKCHFYAHFPYDFSSMMSRFVSITAPFLTLYLPDVTFAQLPFIIFGAGTLLGAACSFFIPESLGHPLPDTIEEAARMGHKPFCACWSSARLREEVAKQRELNIASNS